MRIQVSKTIINLGGYWQEGIRPGSPPPPPPALLPGHLQGLAVWATGKDILLYIADVIGIDSLRTVFQRTERTSSPSWRALQRTNTDNSKQIFPENELRGHSPNFHIYVSLNDLYITTIDLPILL